MLPPGWARGRGVRNFRRVWLQLRGSSLCERGCGRRRRRWLVCVGVGACVFVCVCGWVGVVGAGELLRRLWWRCTCPEAKKRAWRELHSYEHAHGRSVMTLGGWALISSRPRARGLGSTWWVGGDETMHEAPLLRTSATPSDLSTRARGLLESNNWVALACAAALVFGEQAVHCNVGASQGCGPTQQWV